MPYRSPELSFHGPPPGNRRQGREPARAEAAAEPETPREASLRRWEEPPAEKRNRGAVLSSRPSSAVERTATSESLRPQGSSARLQARIRDATWFQKPKAKN